MAVVEFMKKDLERIVGRRLTDKEYRDVVPMMGAPLERIDRERVEYEIFPDRPDMLSVEGFGRALRSFLDIERGLRRYSVKEGKIKVRVEKSVKAVRPYISCAVLRNVRIDEDVLRSLMQVQEKLHETFGRKRKKIAIGIHDLDKVEPPFTYKAVRPESVRFVPLDSSEEMNLMEIYKKHPKGHYAEILKGSRVWPIIIDRNGDVLSFPPVINGELTRVTPETRNIFIDVTGTHQRSLDQTLNILVTSLADRGAVIEGVEVEGIGRRPNLEPRRMRIGIDYVNRLLDMDLNEEEFRELVEGMGFGYDGQVLIPPYRADIMHPIDIVEEVAIKHGYQNFEPRIPKVPTIAKPHPLIEYSEKIANLMCGFGFQETVGMVLTNEVDLFDRMRLKRKPVARTENPINENYNVCRSWLIPSLMRVLQQNRNRAYPQRIFEIGDVVIPDENEETGVRMERKLGVCQSDTRVDYSELASILDSLLKNLGFKCKLAGKDHPSFIKSRSAEIIVKGRKVGVIGELHPEVLENWSLEKPVVGFEVSVTSL